MQNLMRTIDQVEEFLEFAATLESLATVGKRVVGGIPPKDGDECAASLELTLVDAD